MGDPVGFGANLLAIISAFKDPKELVAKLGGAEQAPKGSDRFAPGSDTGDYHTGAGFLFWSIYSDHNAGNAQRLLSQHEYR